MDYKKVTGSNTNLPYPLSQLVLSQFWHSFQLFPKCFKERKQWRWQILITVLVLLTACTTVTYSIAQEQEIGIVEYQLSRLPHASVTSTAWRVHPPSFTQTKSCRTRPFQSSNEKENFFHPCKRKMKKRFFQIFITRLFQNSDCLDLTLKHHNN